MPTFSFQLTKSQSTLLDLVRGLSAQLVVIGHAFGATGHPIKVTVQDLGVVMFFLLSGFLVTASAMRRDNFTDFFIDRAARMFTPYLPCLALIAIAGLILNLGGPYDVRTAVGNVFMLQDFPLSRFMTWAPEIARLGTGRPLWSVAMEWWFYMALGGLIFMRQLPRWAILPVAGGIFVAAFNLTVGMLFYTWLAGAAAALFWDKLKSVSWSVALFAIALVLAWYRYKIAADEFYDLRLNLLIAVAVFLGLRLAQDLTLPKWMDTSARSLASYSYTLYLTHYTVLAALAGLDGWTRIATVLFMANVVAIVLYFAFERHYREVSVYLRGKLRNAPTGNRGN